jgi:hypothetical protein
MCVVLSGAWYFDKSVTSAESARKPSLDKQQELHRVRGFGRDEETMKKESLAVSISSPSLNWTKICRITVW